LDTVTENSVQEALNALGQNRTVLIIAHRLSTIRNADQIVVLDGGVVVEKGTHDALVNIEGGYYQRLWKMQIRQKDEDGASSTLSSPINFAASPVSGRGAENVVGPVVEEEETKE
jgi:ABC-type glutathione transport system ATPase component